MKINLKLIVFVFGALLLAGASLDTTAQTMSLSTAPRSIDAPNQGPAGATNPPPSNLAATSVSTAPLAKDTNAPAIPNSGGSPIAAPSVPLIANPNLPPVKPKLTDSMLTTLVRTSITQAPIASNASPSTSVAGVSVTDLKITTTRGKVTLRGIVHSQKEKHEAGARAASAAGLDNVINLLIVR